MTTVPDAQPSASQVLPHAAPRCANACLALFAIRRMGAGGLADAHAAHAFVGAFGESFRRPLVLMRVLMADLAATSTCPIAIAPCCCARMTPAENALMAALSQTGERHAAARLLLRDLLGVRHVDGVLASAAAVTQAFADAGRRISR